MELSSVSHCYCALNEKCNHSLNGRVVQHTLKTGTGHGINLSMPNGRVLELKPSGTKTQLEVTLATGKHDKI